MGLGPMEGCGERLRHRRTTKPYACCAQLSTATAQRATAQRHGAACPRKGRHESSRTDRLRLAFHLPVSTFAVKQVWQDGAREADTPLGMILRVVPRRVVDWPFPRPCDRYCLKWYNFYTQCCSSSILRNRPRTRRSTGSTSLRRRHSGTIRTGLKSQHDRMSSRARS